MTTDSLQGTCDPRFHSVRQALADNIDDGQELGLSMVVDIDGRTVLDLWGGHRDTGRERPWERDTIVNVWSTTKTVTNLAALVLVDRGRLDVDAPVATYWPEFAANGKEGVLLRHIMSHTSGVSGWEQPFRVQDCYDWERSTAALAAQAPWWEPGTASGYHAANLGHLVGEVVRRVSGRSLKQFVAEELAGPLGADFQIGARPQDQARITDVVPPPPVAIDMSGADPDSVLIKTFTCGPTSAEVANTSAWRAADIGAVNGHGNARSVARIMSAIALGGTSGGVRLLSPATIELIFREQAHGVDLFLGIPMRWGLGYALPEPAGVPFVPEGRICFWGGWGGSMIIMDLDHRMTISYTMNRMKAGIIGSDAAATYVEQVYAALGRPIARAAAHA